MTAKYYTLLTEVGAAKLANATALGVPLKLTHMAVGDGGGTLPTPSSKQVALVGEKRRAALNSLSIDPQNASQIIAEQVIPESDGGWWVREIGLFDEAGDLIAVGNCPESYKPQLAEGSGRTQTVRMVIITSSTDNITLKIDPSVVLATRGYVDNLIETRQQKSDTLTALAALKPAKGKLPYFTAEKAAALADLSDFIRLMLNKGDAAGVLEYLGLGGAAKLNVGAVAGTVAAGDDSRIVNAVQPSNPAICTAWVNFSGANTATIRSSFNVSSVTRLSAGKYQINFGTPMNNSNYAPGLTIGDSASSGSASAVVTLTSSTTGDPVKKDVDGINITTRGSSGAFDYSEINAIFFGGK